MLENVALAGRLAGWTWAQAISEASVLLKQLGLEKRIHFKVQALSGGERQRVSIARALVGEPQLLVLDEPTSALDSEAENSITEVLRDLRSSCTLVVVAHRLSTLEFCDRVLLVDNGRIVEIGSGSDIQSPGEVRRLAERVLAEQVGVS